MAELKCTQGTPENVFRFGKPANMSPELETAWETIEGAFFFTNAPEHTEGLPRYDDNGPHAKARLKKEEKKVWLKFVSLLLG